MTTAPTLFSLATQFDGTATNDWERRIALGEQMRPLLGPRYDEFDRRYGALVEAHPGYPFAAEAIVRGMGLVPAEEDPGSRPFLAGTDDSLRLCGCAQNGTQRIAQCDLHAGTPPRPSPGGSAPSDDEEPTKREVFTVLLLQGTPLHLLETQPDLIDRAVGVVDRILAACQKAEARSIGQDA